MYYICNSKGPIHGIGIEDGEAAIEVALKLNTLLGYTEDEYEFYVATSLEVFTEQNKDRIILLDELRELWMSSSMGSKSFSFSVTHFKCAECNNYIRPADDYMFNAEYTIRFHLKCFKHKPAAELLKLTGMSGYVLKNDSTGE